MITGITSTIEPLKVISVAHSAAFFGSSRLRYYPIASDVSIDLKLIVPNRWKEYGRSFLPDPPSPPLNISIYPIRIPSFWQAKWYCHYYPALSTLLDELKPQVLHLWEEPWSVVALQATRLLQARFPEMALVLETEQNILRRLPPPFEQIRRYTLRRTDMLIARQEEALSVSRTCGYSGPGTIVEYCVDRTCFKPHPKADSREEFGIRGFTIGYVGRLVKEKGLFVILEALSRCKKDVQLVLVGEGPDKEALQARILELNLAHRVRLLGSQPKEAISRFLSSVDLLVLMSLTTHSWKEQFGRVIIEAHACGTPVAGSDSGAIPDVVGKGGWIVPEGDVESMTELFDKLLAEPALLDEASREALINADRFSPERISGALREAYTGAFAHRNGSRV